MIYFKIVKCGYHWKTTYEFRNQPILQQILWFEMIDHILFRVFPTDVCPKTNGLTPDSSFDDFIEIDKSSTADEEDVGGIYLHAFLLGMFTPSLGRNVGNGSFNDF